MGEFGYREVGGDLRGVGEGKPYQNILYDKSLFSIYKIINIYVFMSLSRQISKFCEMIFLF